MNNKLELIDYQFKSITTAIDLFSQILSMEQIYEYGFKFVVDTLKLDSAAIYILEEDKYVLKKRTGICEFEESELYNSKIDKIATLYGRTLVNNFECYFSDEFINKVSCKFIIPIIVKSKVCGFIMAGDIKKEYLDLVTLDFIEVIKNIFNISVYNAMSSKKILALEKEIDKKVFNLSFVNQSAKLLFSELKLEKLFQLCIDMIRELTSSGVTSFSLYDEGRSKLVLKGYNDIIDFRKFYIEIDVKNISPDTSRSVFHIKDDEEILCEIFEDLSDFKKLSAEYIILLKKDTLIGVATVGLPVNEKEYDKQTLNQIESLSAYIYISIMNALYVEKINMQKSKIENQLDSISKLNRIIKNINSCENIDEMMEIASETIEMSYGINKAMIFVRNIDNKLELIESIGLDRRKNYVLDENSKLLDIEEFYFDFEFSNSSKYIDTILNDFSQENLGNCIVIAPIKLDIFELDNNGVLGYVIIWNTSHMLKSNELVCFETLTNSMAPIVRQFIIQKQKMKVMTYDQKKLFVEKNDEMHFYKVRYQMEYRVYYKFLHCELFDKIDLTKYDALDYYYFSCMLVYPVYVGEDVDEEIFDGYVDGEAKETLEKLGLLHRQFVEILGKNK